MKKKLLIGVGIVVTVYLIAWFAAAPGEKIKAGDTAPPLALVNIHGNKVTVPDPKAKWVHLQFRRFAGCPICNLHLQSFVQRYKEIEAAGIHEVVIFHSPDSSLLPYQGAFPFDVVGDPEKIHYAEYGVGASVFAILDVRAWPAIVKGATAKDKPAGDPEGGALGLPADFLINPQGKVVASHYGRHAYDQWSVTELLALSR